MLEPRNYCLSLSNRCSVWLTEKEADSIEAVIRYMLSERELEPSDG